MTKFDYDFLQGPTFIVCANWSKKKKKNGLIFLKEYPMCIGKNKTSLLAYFYIKFMLNSLIYFSHFKWKTRNTID